MIELVDRLSRPYKQAISVAYDMVFAAIIAYAAIVLRLDSLTLPDEYQDAIFLFPFVVLFTFHLAGLYQVIARYVGARFLIQAIKATLTATLIWLALIWFLDLSYPRSSVVIACVFLLGYLTLSRATIRVLFKRNAALKLKPDSVLIFGAGEPGRQILRLLENSHTRKAVAFIDDKRKLINAKVDDVKVYGRKDIPDLIESFNVKEIFLSIPPANEARKREIIQWLYQFPVKVYKLENVDNLIAEEIKLKDLQEIRIEDILGRDPVKPHPELLTSCIQNKVVMVTGAGGSIGSQLCREVIKHKPQKLILVEISEFNLYQIEHELTHELTHELESIEMHALLGDVKNECQMHDIMTRFGVHTIYHAAAYKHVPIVEHNIESGIQNNTFGTLTLASLAGKLKIEHFILVSTDKAVRPTNFMGASKRLAEMCLQALQDEHPQTCYVTVRFGNVLGSSGSVVPLFRKQIAQNGPVTITHPEITRYFMTIPEAVSLVIQAGSMGKGRDVFLLDMGEPVKIIDLAKNMIMLSGRTPKDEFGHGDIEIQYTGLRPGEKLYEELLIDADAELTDHPRIKRATENYLPWSVLSSRLEELRMHVHQKSYCTVMQKLAELVPGFTHHDPIVDPFNQPS